MLDLIINEFDKALKVLTVETTSERPRPDKNFKNSYDLTLVRYVRKHCIEDNFSSIKIIKFKTS